MPSIAQQDYIVIAPKVAETIDVDAYALGQLAKIHEKNDTSIFDVILHFYLDQGSGFCKIITAFDNSPSYRKVGYFDCEDNSTNVLNLLYTSTQYEGLAAVQEAGEAQKPGAGFKDGLPEFSSIPGHLYEDSTGYFITDLEGHKISVTAADRKIATVAISDMITDNGVKVPFEEIQKLVGLPIKV